MQGTEWGLLSSSVVDIKGCFGTTYHQLHQAMSGLLPGSLIGIIVGGAISDYLQIKSLYFLGICLLFDGIVHYLLVNLNLIMFGILEFIFETSYRAKSVGM